MSTEINVDHTSDPDSEEKALYWPSKKALEQTCPSVETHWDGRMSLLPEDKHSSDVSRARRGH